MFFFKFIILIVIFGTCSIIGIKYSKKFENRYKNLKEIKNMLNIFKTKIKYTYEPLPEIFNQISKNTYEEVGEIFFKASEKMKKINAQDAWRKSIDESNIEISKEDKNVLKGMSKLLGKTNIEGQINEIELTENFLNKQIEDAEKEKNKNVKLYKTLGITIGLAIVILLL